MHYFLTIIFLFHSAFAVSFNILDYGAVNDSTVLSTEAIQNTVNAAAENGGGEVMVPPGVYLSGTIMLKSNVTLNVMAGARIKGSPNIDDYIKMTWGHNKDRQPYHLIAAKDVENIAIIGGGTIDGNGPAFWQPHDPAEDPQWIMAKKLKVSPLVEIENCRNVRLRDVLLKTGGGWTLHLYNSVLVNVDNIRILNHLFSPNGDGIDITGGHDITISNCVIKTCDDAICLKTTGDSDECRRVTVTNCVLECSCAALKIGNESFRDIEQVTISNCVVYNSSRAFAIYAESAGTVQDIAVNTIVCDTRAPLLYNRPIHLSLQKRVDSDGVLYSSKSLETGKIYDAEGREPQLRNISISDFTARTGGRILITAAPGMQIEDLTLCNIKMDYEWIEDPKPYIDRAKSSQFSPKNPDAKMAEAAVVVENVDNFILDGLQITWPQHTEFPQDWIFPKKIANGTLDSFYPDYSRARQTEYSAVWGRGLTGGYIFAPLATASDSTRPIFDLKSSSIRTLSTKIEE